MKTIEAAAADCVVDGIHNGLGFDAAVAHAKECFPTCDPKAVVAALFTPERKQAVREALVAQRAEEIWHESRFDLHESFTLDGQPMRETFDFSDPNVPGRRRRVLADFATLRHWREDAELLSADGETARAKDQRRLLEVALERAGGDYNARVIDVIDNPPAAV